MHRRHHPWAKISIVLSAHRVLSRKFPKYRTATLTARRVRWSLRGLRWFELRGYVDLLGQLWRRELPAPGGRATLVMRPTKSEFVIRTHSSDSLVVEQVFLREEYRRVPANNRGWIVDLGANVGASAAYFLARNPVARIVAVEPFDDNFALLSQNLKPFGDRVRLLQAAIWSDSGELRIDGDESPSHGWSIQVSKSGSGHPVQALTLRSILDRFQIQRIDVLKVDIEGAEEQLFSGDTEWLGLVEHLAIEIHGEDRWRVVRAALAPYEYEFVQAGEIALFRNIRRR